MIALGIRLNLERSADFTVRVSRHNMILQIEKVDDTRGAKFNRYAIRSTIMKRTIEEEIGVNELVGLSLFPMPTASSPNLIYLTSVCFTAPQFLSPQARIYWPARTLCGAELNPGAALSTGEQYNDMLYGPSWPKRRPSACVLGSNPLLWTAIHSQAL